MLTVTKACSLNESANSWVGLRVFSFGCKLHDSFHSFSPPFLKLLHQWARGLVLEERNEEAVHSAVCMYLLGKEILTMSNVCCLPPPHPPHPNDFGKFKVNLQKFFCQSVPFVTQWGWPLLAIPLMGQSRSSAPVVGSMVPWAHSVVLLPKTELPATM